MPRPKGTGIGASERFIVRLDSESAAFYRSKANANGMSISEYLRRTLLQGVIAESVQEIESRLMQVVERFGSVGDATESVKLPPSVFDEMVKSVLLSEAILQSIVQARDIQELYKAQDVATQKFNKIRGL